MQPTHIPAQETIAIIPTPGVPHVICGASGDRRWSGRQDLVESTVHMHTSTILVDLNLFNSMHIQSVVDEFVNHRESRNYSNIVVE